MEEYALISDIPQLTEWPAYRINMPWNYIESWLDRNREYTGIELDPDFQRGHVWTPEQRSRYVEFRLRGGQSAKDILWNAPDWHGHKRVSGPMQLVDGLQRLSAVRDFMADRLPVFGKTLSQYADRANVGRMTSPDFIFHVNDLPTRSAVLRWYLELNGGGTPHSKSELERVAKMLEAADA